MTATRGAPIPIVALDVPTLAAAKELVHRLGPAADFYKVGLQLYTREGPAVIAWLRSEAKRVFLDLKLHDIPNTVRGAAASAGSLGVDLLTVHAIGGEAMLRAAVEGAASTGGGTGVLGVTVLTSFSDAEYAESMGTPVVSVATAVSRLAALSASCGARGVVCAGAEAAGIRAIHGEALGTLVPGLRTPGSSANDQARTSTPHDIRVAGATWVVVGRAVTAARDPKAAFRDVVSMLS